MVVGWVPHEYHKCANLFFTNKLRRGVKCVFILFLDSVSDFLLEVMSYAGIVCKVAYFAYLTKSVACTQGSDSPWQLTKLHGARASVLREGDVWLYFLCLFLPCFSTFVHVVKAWKEIMVIGLEPSLVFQVRRLRSSTRKKLKMKWARRQHLWLAKNNWLV